MIITKFKVKMFEIEKTFCTIFVYYDYATLQISNCIRKLLSPDKLLLIGNKKKRENISVESRKLYMVILLQSKCSNSSIFKKIYPIIKILVNF